MQYTICVNTKYALPVSERVNRPENIRVFNKYIYIHITKGKKKTKGFLKTSLHKITRFTDKI